jgi:hypothetical protein
MTGLASAEQHPFAKDVRDFTRAKLPNDIRTKVMTGRPLTRADYMRCDWRLYVTTCE